MKKAILGGVVAVLLIAGVLMVAVPLMGQFAGIQYEKRVQMDLLIAAGEEEWLYAEQNGVKTQVLGGNLSRISRLLTPSEAKHLMRIPEMEPEITLSFSNGDVIRIASDDAADDRAIVLLDYSGKRTAFAIEGYRVIKNVGTAVSPEGFYDENILMEGE